MPDHKDISVIVQGPLVHGTDGKREAAVTREVLGSVRKHLPDAELILSTWEGEDTRNLEYDQLVSSEDPGSLGERNQLFAANLIRQIVSTANGLARGRGGFALKLRTDTMLTSDRFVGLWEERQGLGLKPWLFQSRLLVSAVSTPRPLRCARPYWISDFLGFGRMGDLKRLWSTRFPEAGVAEYLPDLGREQSGKDKGNDLTRPLTPEQILVINLLANHGISTALRTCSSMSPFEMFRSERFIASQFIPVDPPSAGFLLPDKFRSFTSGATIYRDDSESSLFLGATPAAATLALSLRIPEILVGCARVTARRLVNRLHDR